MIPMNSLGSPKNSEWKLNRTTSNEDFILDFPLPQESQFLVDGKIIFGYDQEGFKTILKIYKTYKTLGKVYGLYYNDLSSLEEENDLLEDQLNECKITLDKTDEDREFIYEQRERDIQDLKKEVDKSNLKVILFSGGAGIVGIGIGIIVGLFAF